MAATAQGQYGSQIWISKRTFRQADAVRPISARLIMGAVRENRAHAGLIIVSAHAPTEKATEVEKAEFDDALHSNLRCLYSAYPTHQIAVMMDANGTVGNIKSDGMGKCQVELETRNGELLRMFVNEFGVWCHQHVS
jgi:hypothetical protein